jgi:hypothetical protein
LPNAFAEKDVVFLPWTAARRCSHLRETVQLFIMPNCLDEFRNRGHGPFGQYQHRISRSLPDPARIIILSQGSGQEANFVPFRNCSPQKVV